MLKPLLFILVIVSLIALALNFNLFSNSTTSETIIKSSVEDIKIAPTPKDEIVLINKKNIIIVTESNLSKELQELLNKAQKLFRKSQNSEAILTYEEVIAKSKKSNDIKILKLFAQACFEKAKVHYSYPDYDIDSALESYELIINNFKDKYNKNLLITYMEAKIQYFQFTSKEEIVVAYDELIEKFQKDKEKRFEKEIEDMRFSKSFSLMGTNDEEAIEVLDSIINKYSDKSNLPNTVRFSILNNIELSIITSNDTEEYVDLANEYMAESPNTKPLLDMLSIIKDAQELEQSEALKQWNTEHSEYVFPEWDFSDLRKWVNKMERPESQKRIRQYLDLFEKQKYKHIYKTPIAKNTVYSEEATQKTYPNPYASVDNSDNEEVIYEEAPVYEPDPYLNDIINSQPEISYLNPNSNSEQNIQMDANY